MLYSKEAPNVPKMLVLDLDGTLLDDNKEIPEENIVAIRKLNEDFGVIPVIATARPLDVAKYIAGKGGKLFQKYIIATNGAIVQELETGKYLVNKSFTPAQIDALFAAAKEDNLECEFMTTECEVADAHYKDRRDIDPMYENMGQPFNFQDNLQEYAQRIDKPIPLFAISGTLEELEDCLPKLSKIDGLQISTPCARSTPDGKSLAYFDIMRKGVTKSSAIETLADYLGIKKEEIIAFGDGGNDVEMFQTAGLKVAMKNASEGLKEIADIITPVDNNHAGVGYVVNAIRSILHERQIKYSKLHDDDKEIA